MAEIVNIDAFNKNQESREDMIDILERALERVHSGEAIGTVVTQTTNNPACTYNSVGGKCMSLLMLATLQVLVTKVATHINDNSEDVT